MLRNIIKAPTVTEIYELASDIRRGSLVTKDLTTGKAVAAEGVGVDVWIVDADNQPTGAYSDVEISQYDDSLDVVKGRAVLVKYGVGGQFGTDQVDGSFEKGEYAIAGTGANAGKFVKANSGETSIFKFIGLYDDAGHVLHRFEVVEPVTVS